MPFDVMMVFDIILTGVGIYLVIAAFRMKRAKEIPSLLATQEEAGHCRDREGFIRTVYKKLAGLGTLAAGFGAASLLNGVWPVVASAYVLFAARVLFLAGCMWLLSRIRTEREKYFAF